MVKELVRLDSKQRYDLILEDVEGSKVAIDLNATSSDAVGTQWWIKARQGHSIKVRSFLPPRSTIYFSTLYQTVQLELRPITSIEDIPTRIAVHGTNRKAWSSIRRYLITGTAHLFNYSCYYRHPRTLKNGTKSYSSRPGCSRGKRY
jgi:2'-phosphotransferase